MGLISNRRQAADALLQGWVAQVSYAGLDRVIEPFESQIGFGGALVQFGDMLAPALRPLLAAVQHGGQNLFQPLGRKQAVFDVAGDEVVQLFHRDGSALAAGLALPGLDRAGIVAIAAAFAGPQRHRAPAIGAEADARKEGGAADDAGGCDPRVARSEMRLNGVEGRLVDQRRNLDRHDLAGGLQFLGLAALVELVAADIGRSGQNAVQLSDAPAPAVAREDAALIEVVGDALHAQGAAGAVALQRKAIDQPHRVGVQRIDFQLLLGLCAALLGRDDAVADGRQGAVPKTLTRVLLQSAENMLGVFLRLVFIKQRHDLPHHDVHRVVAHFLGDRDEPDAVLRQLADVEFEFEMVPEEAAERMDNHDIERRGIAGSRLDHALEFGAAVVGGGCAWFDVGFGELVAARLAICLALPFLIRDGDVMLRLPRRRDAQIEGGAQGNGHAGSLLTSSRRPEKFIEQVAKPCFEYVDFVVHDRHVCGPIVDDTPRRDIMFDGAAKARPGTGHDI